ncbi:hypothetical protein BDA96_06G006700 [Sorghum bicolor]|uniref:Uncharacterized protein n=2 Tax=Sorghum bicolor TaxID=4558 RepID=A0A921QPW3_SORBI|nr:hypothetical protein BDA96_06G006700 [Sorghum bicolor]OQU81067.1 hypothetical protein SORBI_3006G006450 [Sorghum bicolor]
MQPSRGRGGGGRGRGASSRAAAWARGRCVCGCRRRQARRGGIRTGSRRRARRTSASVAANPCGGDRNIDGGGGVLLAPLACHGWCRGRAAAEVPCDGGASAVVVSGAEAGAMVVVRGGRPQWGRSHEAMGRAELYSVFDVCSVFKRDAHRRCCRASWRCCRAHRDARRARPATVLILLPLSFACAPPVR